MTSIFDVSLKLEDDKLNDQEKFQTVIIKKDIFYFYVEDSYVAKLIFFITLFSFLVLNLDFFFVRRIF